MIVDFILGSICLFALIFLAMVITVLIRRRGGQAWDARIRTEYALDELYVSRVGASIIGISFKGKRIVLGSHVAQHCFDWSQITAVEVIKDGVTLTETNRGSQLGSAAVGGLVFGPVGAMIGGLSGSTVSHSRITNLDLKITVDDRSNPVFVVTFFRNRTRKGSASNSFLVKQAQESMARMHGHLANAIRRSQATAWESQRP